MEYEQKDNEGSAFKAKEKKEDWHEQWIKSSVPTKFGENLWIYPDHYKKTQWVLMKHQKILSSRPCTEATPVLACHLRSTF